MPFDLALFDWIALGWFFGVWIAYNTVFDWLPSRRPPSLNRTMAVVRAAWMRRMLERENRVMDSMLLGHLIGSVSFFASATVLLLAGLVGGLAAAEDLHRVVQDLGFTQPTGQTAFELKLLLLFGIFIYVFFKLTWALRQFNYTVAFIGAAPLLPVPPARGADIAEDAAALMSLAVASFNAGIRGYYFAFAALGWLMHPAAFIVFTAWVVGVLMRRQIASNASRRVDRCARDLEAPIEPGEPAR